MPTSQPPALPGLWLTPDCQRVQGEILDLTNAMSDAALGAYPELKTSLLRAIEEFRQHLREHLARVEGDNGLLQHLAGSSPQASPRIGCIRQEHCEIESCLDELQSRLDGSILTEPAAVEAIRHSSLRLAGLIQCHHATGCKLMNEIQQRTKHQGAPS